MSVMRRAVCLLGRHSGEWTHPGSRCEIVRICESCAKRDERSRHAWGPFRYVRTDECEQVRRCERCGGTDARTRHEWGPWFYRDNEFNAAQEHTCRRCHEVERTAYTMR